MVNEFSLSFKYIDLMPPKNFEDSDSLVQTNISVLAIISFVHLVELGHDVLLIVVDDDSRDRCSSLRRLFLELLLLRWVYDDVYLA